MWDEPDESGEKRAVAVKFAGRKGDLAYKFFYNTYLSFTRPRTPPIESCTIEDLVLIKVLLYIEIGKGLKIKPDEKSPDFEIVLDFDIIEDQKDWALVDTDIVLDLLVKLFKENYPFVEDDSKTSVPIDPDVNKPIKNGQPIVDRSTKLDRVGDTSENVFKSHDFKKDGRTAESLPEIDSSKESISKPLPSFETKPEIIGIVPSRHDEFVGRVGELERLYEIVSTTRKVVYIHGIAGIGKTSLVKVFVDRFGNNFDHVAWIDITRAKGDFLKDNTEENAFRLEDAFGSIYRFLNSGRVNKDLSAKKQFEDTVGMLNKYQGHNLLVIDNYDESILQYLNRLPRNPKWKILVTGRSNIPGTVIENFPLNSLLEQDAISLFQKFYNKKIDQKFLEKFFVAIGYHTLMIEITAKSLSESDTLTLEYIYERFSKGQLNDPELDQLITTDNGENAKLIKHLLFLFDVETLSKDEISILKTWYYLPPTSYTAKKISDFIATFSYQ